MTQWGTCCLVLCNIESRFDVVVKAPGYKQKTVSSNPSLAKNQQGDLGPVTVL